MRRERMQALLLPFPIQTNAERHQSLIIDLRFTTICASPPIPIAHYDDPV
jgi:hypothetical protein